MTDSSKNLRFFGIDHDQNTKTTTLIFTLVICSIIVILYKENNNLARLTKYLMIQNIVYLTGGWVTSLVRIDKFSFFNLSFHFPLKV